MSEVQFVVEIKLRMFLQLYGISIVEVCPVVPFLTKKTKSIVHSLNDLHYAFGEQIVYVVCDNIINGINGILEVN